MVQLLKMKERIYRFVGHYEIYVMSGIRFLIAFTAFKMINTYMSYMSVIEDLPVALVLALLCSFLPSGMMVFFGALLLLAQFYALSVELFGITAVVFLLLFCLYIRFSSRKGLYIVLTPLLGAAGIPYVMPVAAGLLGQVYSVVAVICGEVVYFLIRDVRENAALFTAEDASTESILTQAATQIFLNKEMYLYLSAFAAAAIAVYCVRRMKADHSRTIALVFGIVIQMGVICGGEIYLGNTGNIARVIIGCLISLAVCFAVDFMSLSLDYKRVENVQFEDDEYYYYVKAVPKAYVEAEDKKVKKISSRKSSQKSHKSKKTNGGEDADTALTGVDEIEAEILKAFKDEDGK